MDHTYLDPVKALKWLGILDTLRTKCDVDAIPEALRKCEKYAPGRTLLHQITRSELQLSIVATYVSRPPAPDDQYGWGMVELEREIRPVMMSKEEDVFQAKITQAVAACWTGKYELVSTLIGSKLEEDLNKVIAEHGIHQKQTYVLLAQGAWARGIALVKLDTKEALRWFEQMLRVLDTKVPKEMESDGYQMWYERFLASYCLTISHFVRDHRDLLEDGAEEDCSLEPAAIFTPFKAWQKFINGIVGYREKQQRHMPYNRDTTRDMVWRAAHHTIAVVFHEKVELKVFADASEAYNTLQNTLLSYNEIIMRKSHVPSADEKSEEIEEWVFQITASWKMVMHAPWRNTVLSPTDKIAYTEQIADYLERAAAASFQSVRIYRGLMLTNASLGKTDMVERSLKIYIDYITKAFQRSKTSSAHEKYDDDHEAALATISMGIENLSCYGDQGQKKYAYELTDTVLDWMEDCVKSHSNNAGTQIHDQSGNPRHQGQDIQTHRSVLARAHRAIGLAKVTWANVTPFTDQRTHDLDSAISHYRQAMDEVPQSSRLANTDFLLTLAQIDRSVEDSHIDEAPTAIEEAIKILNLSVHGTGISNDDDLTNIPMCDEGTYEERRVLLLRSWRLLANLRLHQKKRDSALKIIEAAFDVYGGHEIQQGKSASPSAFVPGGLNEKRELIKLKMAEISIKFNSDPVIEDFPEGPDAPSAVKSCLELTNLFSILFQGQDVMSKPASESASANVPKIAQPPSSRRSIRKSLLHLPHHHQKDQHEGSVTSEDASPKQSTTLGVPYPVGQPERHVSKKLQKRPSKRSIARPPSPPPSSTTDLSRHPPGSKFYSPRAPRQVPVKPPTPEPIQEPLTLPYSSDEIGIAVTHDDRISTPTVTSKNGKGISREAWKYEEGRVGPIGPTPLAPIIPAEYLKFPYIYKEVELLHNPEPMYSAEDDERRAQAFLSNMWLFIASVYRKEQYYHEAMEAVEESKVNVDAIWDSVVSSYGLSTVDARQKCVAGLKPIGELLADNLVGKAHILLAQSSSLSPSAEFKGKMRAETEELLAAALSFSPEHLGAALLQSHLLLEKYRPIHAAKMSTADELAPIAAADGLWPLKNGKKVAVGDEVAAAADRDLAVSVLEKAVETPAGRASVAAWQLLGEAKGMKGDVEGGRLASEKALALGEGAYLATKNAVEMF